MVNLSVITLTYNNLKYTKKFIESLYKCTSDFELIIVDNGSTDGTVDYLKNLENIKLMQKMSVTQKEIIRGLKSQRANTLVF